MQQRTTPKSSNQEGMANTQVTTQVATPPPSLESLRISTPSPPSKWNCSACTYENWPRTRKCVLCGILKEATPTREEVTPINSLNLSGSVVGASVEQESESNWDYERR